VRQRSDGKVIEMVGNPLPQGGFVTSFNDITEHIELQHALQESNIDLEKRVQSRAAEVKAINQDLRTEISRRAEIETQLIEARKTAESANLSKTRFLALASHDILQPINAAKLYLAAIKESIPAGDVRSMVEKLDASINASDNMIGTLLEIARLDQGEMQPKPTSIQLTKLLEPLIDEFTMKANNKGLTFHSNIHDVWLNTDPTYLQRIVRNLLSNAVKYTEKGRVVFTARKYHRTVNIRIWDTGVGVPEHLQYKIFEDFYRINDSHARGVGLGLSIVSRLSEQIGASLTVNSQSGKGSCFGFTLPTIAPLPTQLQSKSTDNIGFNALRVLCVDDEWENLEAMAALLSQWQIDVSTATTPTTALEVTSHHPPQALLVDYQLGEQMNGLELILQIREKSDQNIPAIMVTAVRDESLISQLKNNHIHYLAKPVKPAKLRTLLFSLKPNT
jgi:signal transduction histidine kinase